MVTKNKTRNFFDLESFRRLFFLIGLTVSLALVMVAIEWKIPMKQKDCSITSTKIDMEVEQFEVYTKKVQKPLPGKIIITENEIFNENKTQQNQKVKKLKPINEFEPVDVSFSLKYNTKNIELEEELPEPNLIFASKLPQYKGGETELKKYIRKNLKYPAKALEMNIQGRMQVKFLVLKTGKIDSVKVINRDIDSMLIKEAERVIQSMPDWQPGVHCGIPVNVWQSVPVTFKIDESSIINY